MKVKNLKPLIKVVISKPNFLNLAKEYDALIDTGATKTFISDKVINELNLDRSSSGIMTDASNNSKEVDLFILNILLDGHTKSAKIECAEFVGREECDVIIGMDIITNGVLIVRGEDFTFNINILK